MVIKIKLDYDMCNLSHYVSSHGNKNVFLHLSLLNCLVHKLINQRSINYIIWRSNRFLLFLIQMKSPID